MATGLPTPVVSEHDPVCVLACLDRAHLLPACRHASVCTGEVMCDETRAARRPGARRDANQRTSEAKCDGAHAAISSTLDLLRPLAGAVRPRPWQPELINAGTSKHATSVSLPRCNPPRQWPPAVREGRMELQGCRIDKQGLEHVIVCLGRPPSRQEVRWDAEGAALSSLRAVVGDDRTVRSLHLSDNDLPASACLMVAQAIQNNTTVKLLDLSSNAIGDQGATALSAVLVTNSTLEALDVAGNGISQRGLDSLMAGMRCNVSLKSLELSFNGFGHGACASLGVALASQPALEYMGLGFNGICAPGAHMLAHGITMSQSLQRLELSYNALGDSGVAEIAAALKKTRVLHTLGLVSNGIGDSGAEALAASLADNNSIVVLGLSSNHIGDKGAAAFAAALRVNQTLQCLYLEENKVGEAGARDLAAAQATTCTVKAMAASRRLAVMMGLHRRLGQACSFFALDSFICSEILTMCDVRGARDVLFYPKIVSPNPDTAAAEAALPPTF